MTTEVVLFDLGGVLVELRGTPVLAEWIGADSDAEVWRRWLLSPWVRRFERGQCSTAEFGAGIVEDWGLPLTPAAFLENFESWPAGLYPGAEALLESLRDRVRTACFSNTNALHLSAGFDALRSGGLFDACFFSNELGEVKPDRRAFELVIAELGCPPAEILFLDDNQPNVDGARALGIDAHRVLGVTGARALLTQRQILVDGSFDSG